MFAWIAEAWLGPAYQMTAQVNVVNPGGAAQAPHRDYHLGFQSATACAAYPAPVHQMSALLTLQGAVAHCDMPVESGPTLYLPYSQRYQAGFLAWQQPPFRDYFARHCVQLPLSQGDAVFFNPALFHAAGHNRSSDIRRMANLLQVSSPFGRAMEALDRRAMSAALYPALQTLRAQGVLSADGIAHAIAACAEGYAFPSNLDRDQPIDGMAPPTQQQLMHEALAQDWPAARFLDALDSQAWRQQA
ncbi:Phytanoyl-CoA dioxygenase (PhyH) [compost metagenome]